MANDTSDSRSGTSPPGTVKKAPASGIPASAFVAAGIVSVGLLVYLHQVDPSEGGYPACPLHATTGLLCPGCGSLRALHDLLHLRIQEAFLHNALIVVAPPLLVAHLLWRGLRKTRESGALDKALLLGWLLVILGWGVIRNVG